MRLYSIQTLEAYNSLIENGVLLGSDKYIWPEFKSSYDWLVQQMKLKIGGKEYINQYPIWAWFQYHDSIKRKPDLRSTSHLEKGTLGVRIEFEKPDNQVLLSDFNDWHCVLNYWPHIEDDKHFDKLLKDNNVKFGDVENYTPEIHKFIQDSWQNIFDLTNIENRSIQATMWNIKKEEIIKVDYFKAR